MRPSRPITVQRSIAYLTGGGLVSSALYALGGLAIGRLVEPATLGFFNGIGLVLMYASLLQFGVLSGLSRELPYFIGKGDRTRAEELCAAAQAWALALGGIVSMALLGIAVWQLLRGEWWLAAGWFTNSLLALQLFYTNYLQVTYRTAADFAKIALVRVVGQFGMLVLLVLVIPLDFYGLCLRALLGGTLSVALLFRWRPVRVRPMWRKGHLTHLLRVGLPIFLVGQVYAYWAVVDQTLVLKLGGTRMMGLFSMVLMARGAVETLPSAVGQVFFPRMSLKHGEGQSLRELTAGITKPMVVSAAGIVPVVVLLWWLVGPTVRLLIPAYNDAIPAVQWALLMCLPTCFEPGIAALAVVRRQGLRLIALALGIAAYTASLLWLTQQGVRLTTFPQAMLIGQTVYVVVCYAFIYYLGRREEDSGAEAPSV